MHLREDTESMGNSHAAPPLPLTLDSANLSHISELCCDMCALAYFLSCALGT